MRAGAPRRPRRRRPVVRCGANRGPVGVRGVRRSTRKVRQSSRSVSQATRYQCRPKLTRLCGSADRRGVAAAWAGVVEAQPFVPAAGVGDRHQRVRAHRGPGAADPHGRGVQRADPVRAAATAAPARAWPAHAARSPRSRRPSRPPRCAGRRPRRPPRRRPAAAAAATRPPRAGSPACPGWRAPDSRGRAAARRPGGRVRVVTPRRSASVGAGPVAVGLQQRQQPEQPRRGLQHDPPVCPSR